MDSADLVRISNLVLDYEQKKTELKYLEEMHALGEVENKILVQAQRESKQAEKRLLRKSKRATRKAWWSGFKWGGGSGIVATVLLIILI